MDINTKAKQKVLEQIMQMMDERENSFLKSKSPKFAKVDIQTDDPKLAESLKDKLVSGLSEDDQENPLDEMTKKDFKEDLSEGEDNQKKKLNPEEDEDLARLLEMYEKIK